MFSDHVISIAGRSITITSHDIFMTGVSLVIGLVFWIALYFSRKRIVVLKRSSGIDQLTFELSRIADALDRIANRPAERAIAAATRRQLQAPSPPQREPWAQRIPSLDVNETISAHWLDGEGNGHSCRTTGQPI